MKRSKFVVVLCLVAILFTGCVKFNANMDIKKDKSMDFSIIYAVNTSLLGDEELLSAENKKELEEQGFKISDYNQDNMKGFTISRNIKNIDAVSSESDAEYSLSGILDKDAESKYLFKVDKGLLKNKYTAKLKFDAGDSDLNEELSDTEDLTDDNESTDDWDTSVDDDSLDLDSFGSDIDYTSMMSSMDMSFNVTLPYAALSNNATNVSDENKKLTWNLTTSKAETLNFEFELYNMTNIYIGCGIGALLIIFIIACILNKKNTNNTTPEVNVPTTPSETPSVANTPTMSNNITPTENINPVSNENELPQMTQEPSVDNSNGENISSSTPLVNDNPNIFSSQPNISNEETQNNNNLNG